MDLANEYVGRNVDAESDGSGGGRRGRQRVITEETAASFSSGCHQQRMGGKGGEGVNKLIA